MNTLFLLFIPFQVDENNIATNAVPESERSSFLAFVKRALGGIDLSKITAPPFILAPMSTLETNAELMSHPEIFCNIATRETPVERFLECTKWYIARFHKQSVCFFLLLFFPFPLRSFFAFA